MAAWKHAARTEAAALMGRSHATVLIDLEKAFERIQHHRLVEAARQWQYPLRSPRLALAAYRMPRAIGIGRVFSETLVASRGITAGCVFATLELRAMVLKIGDAICSQFPGVQLTMYVDDDTIEAEGDEQTVEEVAVGATKLLCTSLNAVELAISPKKNRCLASSAALGHRIAARLTPWSVQYTAMAKMLGVGVTAGVRRNMQATAQRIKRLAERKENYAKLKRLGIDTGRLLRTGGVSTMTYGLHVHGVSDYMLLQMRRVAAGLCGSVTRGGHHNLELIVTDNGRNRKADPAFDAHELPIGAWAEACWEGRLHYTALEGLVQGARRALLKAKRPRAVVKGPAAAMLASAQRLGWYVRDAMHAVTDAGVELCFEEDSPAMILRHVEESVVRWRWRLAATDFSSLRQAGSGGAEWAPVASLLKHGRWSPSGSDKQGGGSGWCGDEWQERPALTVAERGALRSAITGRQWPQQRLHQFGLADDPLCKLCQANGCEVVGTLAHRHMGCPTVAHCASAVRPANLHRAWRVQHEGGVQQKDDEVPDDSSWWQRAIFPMVGWPRSKGRETFEWVSAPTEPLCGVTFYVDGSMLDGSDPRVAAVGWAVVAVRDGKVVAIARGRAPHYITNIQSAEIWALVIATKLSSDSRSYTDCESVASVARGGYRRATSSKQLYARAWKQVFGNTGRCAPDVVWMPAHKGKEAVGTLAIGDGSFFHRGAADVQRAS